MGWGTRRALLIGRARAARRTAHVSFNTMMRRANHETPSLSFRCCAPRAERKAGDECCHANRKLRAQAGILSSAPTHSSGRPKTRAGGASPGIPCPSATWQIYEQACSRCERSLPIGLDVQERNAAFRRSRWDRWDPCRSRVCHRPPMRGGRHVRSITRPLDPHRRPDASQSSRVVRCRGHAFHGSVALASQKLVRFERRSPHRQSRRRHHERR